MVKQRPGRIAGRTGFNSVLRFACRTILPSILRILTGARWKLAHHCSVLPLGLNSSPEIYSIRAERYSKWR